MYSTSEAKIFNANEGSHFTAGLHENVKVYNARMERSPNKNLPFIEITFEKDGKTFTATEWEPKRFDGMTDKDMKEKTMRQLGRMMQILECFYEENDPRLTFNGANFDEFANWVVELLTQADKSKLVRIKAVYNHKGFISIPSYARYKFIEPMVLPAGKESQVKLIPNVDVLIRPIQADEEQVITNPFAETATTATEAPVYTEPTSMQSDLPF